MPRIITPAKAQKMLNVSAPTLLLWVKQGILKDILKTPGGQNRYSYDEIKALRDASRLSSSPLILKAPQEVVSIVPTLPQPEATSDGQPQVGIVEKASRCRPYKAGVGRPVAGKSNVTKWRLGTRSCFRPRLERLLIPLPLRSDTTDLKRERSSLGVVMVKVLFAFGGPNSAGFSPSRLENRSMQNTY